MLIKRKMYVLIHTSAHALAHTHTHSLSQSKYLFKCCYFIHYQKVLVCRSHVRTKVSVWQVEVLLVTIICVIVLINILENTVRYHQVSIHNMDNLVCMFCINNTIRVMEDEYHLISICRTLDPLSCKTSSMINFLMHFVL